MSSSGILCVSFLLFLLLLLLFQISAGIMSPYENLWCIGMSTLSSVEWRSKNNMKCKYSTFGQILILVLTLLLRGLGSVLTSFNASKARERARRSWLSLMKRSRNSRKFISRLGWPPPPPPPPLLPTHLGISALLYQNKGVGMGWKEKKIHKYSQGFWKLMWVLISQDFENVCKWKKAWS